MEESPALKRATQVVAEALNAAAATEIGGDEPCIAVWPSDADGFVDEFRLLTDKEWQRLLAAGLNLSPGVEAKELYCFRHVPACDGLTVRVLRLVQELQSHRSPRPHSVRDVTNGRQEERTGIWTVLETSEIHGGRLEVTSLRTNPTADSTPPRPTKAAKSGDISPPQLRGKRTRLGDGHVLVLESQLSSDERCAPTKFRRLNEPKARTAVDDSSVTTPPARDQPAKRPPMQSASRMSRRRSRGLSALQNKDSVLSAPSLCNASDAYASRSTTRVQQHEISDVHPLQPSQTLPLIRRMATRSTAFNKQTSSEGVRKSSTVFTALKRMLLLDSTATTAADGDWDDEDGEGANFDGLDILDQPHVAPCVTIMADVLVPVWTALESASIHIHKIFGGLRGISSSSIVSSQKDPQDHDLLWTEEDDQLCWTLFGEPSIRSGSNVRTRRQHCEARSVGTTWRFW